MEETEMILKTHEMISELEKHEFTRQQAEALVDWQARIIAATGDGLLKSDLKDISKDVTRSVTIHLILANVVSALLTVALVWILFL